MNRRRFVTLAASLPIPLIFGCGTDASTDTPTLASPSATLPPASAEATSTTAATSTLSRGGNAPSLTTEPAADDEQSPTPTPARTVTEHAVVAGSRPHDVAPAPGGGVWYTGQGNGTLGLLDPVTGDVEEVHLGAGSAPHGVIVGPDGHAWITDGGLNAIVRVHDATKEVSAFPLPPGRARSNLNTATFDLNGILWFTGQSGVYGRLDPRSGAMEVFDAPRGRGPYGICTTPAGDVYYASLAGSYIAQIDLASGAASPLEPPTAGQGARRVWSDSGGVIWVAEWNAGQLGRYDPATGEWREWQLPGGAPQAYAVYVDERDLVWLTDFNGNAIVLFDPSVEEFDVFPLERPNARVRQLLGRPGEVWGAESRLDALVVVRTI